MHSIFFFVTSAGPDLLLHRLCRYEDLKQQLMAAQNLAEQEGDQQELARAAAAVARLTFPASGPADMPQRPALVLPCCVLMSESIESPMAFVPSQSMVHAAPACVLLSNNVDLVSPPKAWYMLLLPGQ